MQALHEAMAALLDRDVLATSGPGAALRIGLIAPPWVPVPPPVYGGTEMVIDLLARGLTEAGHEVTLFTTGDATAPVARRWVHPRALGTTAGSGGEIRHVEAAYAALQSVDVIHDHTVLGPLCSMIDPQPHAPVVTTVHGQLTPRLRALYRAAARGAAIVMISHHQRSTAPEVPVEAVIHHGIDVDGSRFGLGQGGYLLFLGRMSADKGVHRAIRAARSAGRRLVIAAKMRDPEEHRYFTQCVEPLLGADAVYLGEVGVGQKQDLLCGAEALLNPIRWPEPFGLVMIESLAAGTPVLTFPEGAAPEIIEDGRTGFLCRDEDEMVDRIPEISQIDRRSCRSSARDRFSKERMIRDHLALYRRVIADDTAMIGSPAPATRAPQDATWVEGCATSTR